MPKIIIKQTAPTEKHTSEPYKTGQTISYATGDDGDLQFGNGADWFTLNYNNGFGTTNRFTLKNGTGLTSSNAYGVAPITGGNIIVDWSTWNRVNYKVLCWLNDRVGGGTNTWANQLIACRTAPVGEPASGWNMPDANQILTLCMWNGNGSAGCVICPFFELYSNASVDWWTSTTATHITIDNAQRLNNNQDLTDVVKTGVASAIQCRFYTLTELGL